MTGLFRRLLPNRPVPCRILRGPFRGARVRLNPRSSLRKILGLYEHELNGFIAAVLPKVDTLYDVGANDGYFALGCAAWFARHGVAGSLFAFDPQEVACKEVDAALAGYRGQGLKAEVIQAFVDDHTADGVITLDEFVGTDRPVTRAFVKIDVEGAELRVLHGASKLLTADNHFLVELHSRQLLDDVSALFRDRGLPFEIIHQRALPLVGRESRAVNNCWLVTR